MSTVLAAPLADDLGQAFWRAAEAAHGVHDRYQFFVWLRLHLNRFVPHDLAMCRFRAGPADVANAEPAHLFYSVPLARGLLEALPRPDAAWWRELVERWQAGGGQAAVLPLSQLPASPEVQALRDEGFGAVAVHGIGPRTALRPEATFAFALRAERDTGGIASFLDLALPTLYCTAVRALQPARAEVVAAPAPGWALQAEAAPTGSVLTGRELQILAAVREAKRNAQIGEQLGISPLTVKNHLRKIMRKLNAGNRAQAVAEAMARRLIA